MVKVRVFHNEEEAAAYIKTRPDLKVSFQSNQPREDLEFLGVTSYRAEESRTPIMVIKIGEEEYMQKLLEKGEVFMRSLEEFRKMENETQECLDGRGDAYEGIDAITQVDELYVGDMKVDGCSPIRHNLPGGAKGLIYSLFGVFGPQFDIDTSLSDEVRKMGNTAVVIRDPMVFIDRCATAVRNAGGRMMAGSVQYYDENTGDYFLSPWLKRNKFKAQSEYRLFIPCGHESTYTLHIGSIEDIAEIISL